MAMTLPSHGRGPRFESERAHLLETLKKAQKTVKISGMGQPGVSVEMEKVCLSIAEGS